MDTLDDIKSDEFRKMIKTNDLESMFTEGNYSLFVPTDYALNEYNDKINEMVSIIVYTTRINIEPISFLTLNDFEENHPISL